MLNLPVQTKNNVQVMSSVDLAKLCVGESIYAHKDFKKKAKKVLGKDVGNFSHISKDSYGRDREILLLPEREACLMAMSYSYELQAYVFDEWQKLKGKNSWIEKLSPEAKIAIEDLSKQIEVKDTEIERLQGVCNTVTAQFAHGLTISTLCKSFNGVNIMQVNNTLIKMGMLNKTKYGYEPSSYARDNYFTVSYESFEKPDGSEAQRSSVTLTLKGAKWLYKAYLSNKLPMKKSWDGLLVHVEFEVKSEI